MFQSTRPAWGATPVSTDTLRQEFRFNPRAPRGARHCCPQGGIIPFTVSIHAPRVGRDTPRDVSITGHINVSIHAPRVGRDTIEHKACIFNNIMPHFCDLLFSKHLWLCLFHKLTYIFWNFKLREPAGIFLYASGSRKQN